MLIAKPLGQSLDDLANVSRWRAAIHDQPAVRRGIELAEDLRRSASPTDEERRILFKQSARS